MESLRKTREDIRGNLKIIRRTSGKTQGETWGKPEGKPGKIKGKPRDNADKTKENPKKQREENQTNQGKPREYQRENLWETRPRRSLGETWEKLGMAVGKIYGKSRDSLREIQ